MSDLEINWKVADTVLEELQIAVGSRRVEIFMQDGFFVPLPGHTALHRHGYTEIQLLICGNARYLVDGRTVALTGTGMVAIPRGVFHCGVHDDTATLRIAFQVDWPLERLFTCPLPESEAEGLYQAIQTYRETGESLRMELYLALICSNLPDACSVPPRSVEDRGFIINEFFSNHYSRDITLTDLAAVLSVSGRQASRLVEQYTGHSFQAELIRCRVQAARQLMRETGMRFEQVAEAVGYRSASGLWKILNREK